MVETKYLLNDNCQDILLAPISISGIKNIVFNAKVGKIPGPDDFGVKFNKTHWEEINTSIFEVVTKLFRSGKILENLRSKSTMVYRITDLLLVVILCIK